MPSKSATVAAHVPSAVPRSLRTILRAAFGPADRRRRPGTFAKLAVGYCLLEVATYWAYLVRYETPPLGEAFREQPVIFGSYVATLVVAAVFGNRVHNRLSRLGRFGLSDTPGGDRVAMFYPAVRVISQPIRYTDRHPYYLERLAWLLIVFSAAMLVRIGFYPESVPKGGGRALEVIALFVFPFYCWILLFHEYYRGYLFQLRYMRRLHDKQQLAERAIYDAEMLRIKNREQEEVMALVAHKFRGSLDRIVYNIDHGSSAWVYRESVSTMRGLLDIFGLISADTEMLRRKLKEEHGGTGTLDEVAARSLGLALCQLLSPRGSERIQQHFLSFARHTGLVAPATSLRLWYEEHGSLAERLRLRWQEHLMDVLPGADLPRLAAWLEERFFPLRIEGLLGLPVRFAPYGTGDSLFTILLTEAFTNLLKYYASTERAPVALSASLDEARLNIALENPTTPSASAMVKGSGRGHDFVALLVEKLDGRVGVSDEERRFRLAIELPAGLFVEGTP